MGHINLLETINSPEDLRRLPEVALDEVARELREVIIKTVFKTGGHLASNLGVVELTLALHYVFNTPRDKLIWDVGHQAYSHKLLTGRRDSFATLRQYKGISGFPKQSESKYDAFDTGHGSTSISAGLGAAIAKCLKKDSSRVISIIGDGSMTGGMAFEALNQAGHLDKNLIVILNDNEMSISPNVGALSSFLSRKMTSERVVKAKDGLKNILKSFSNTGENILQVLKRSEESFKSFFTPGMLFEALKFKYVGPINGHDMEALLETLQNVRNYSHGPVLIHVVTTKGKGYPPAEKNPGDYHGVGSFYTRTGHPHKSSSAAISYTKCFGDTIIEMAEKDPKVVAITAAMPAGTGLQKFAERFPSRFFDVGMAEEHGVTFAAGLASEGMKPVVAIYSTFLQRSLDQIIHDVCLQNLPVTFAIDRGGVVGDDGPTHHGVFDLSYLRFIPNMVLMAPKDEDEMRHMLFTATQHNGPATVRYPRGSGEGVNITTDLETLPIAQGELLREGNDILLLPIGNRVYPALEAADGLEKLGISISVINPRFIKPLDKKLIMAWAEKTGKVITIEDNAKQGGFGSSILELLARQSTAEITCKTLGYPDIFIEHGPQQTLWKNYCIDTPGIIKAAIKMMKNS